MSKYFWTKTWGAPRKPSISALSFNSKKARDDALARLSVGDIVIYLTSDATHSDPAFKGRVSGAVEILGEPKLSSDVDGLEENARKVDFRSDGRFRWPFLISVSRSWRVIDQETNDNLIENHAEFGIQGAATIHEMNPIEINQFCNLRVEEVTEAISTELPLATTFSASLRRPWKQKEGQRTSATIVPGTDLYIAVLSDDFGMTFKVGSGKSDERLKMFNLYRRKSLGEPQWSFMLVHTFSTVDLARDAEDYILITAKNEGFESSDNSEFIHGISFNRLKAIFNDAINRSNDHAQLP